MAICPSCGQENPEGARFCNACGAPLGRQELPAQEERKLVSVLFLDIVDFTARAELMDPEDVRALQDSYWSHVRSEVERHGGTVEKFIGDAVVGLFGAPAAHEGDAERAVRAGIAVRDWAIDRGDLGVRVAVTTGEALVRLPAQPLAGEGMASGDVVNTASRLQQAAAPNTVLVDAMTREAVGDAVEFSSKPAVTAKGKGAAIAVWEAVVVVRDAGADTVEHTRTRLIGRERELELLRGAVVRVREDRTPQLVTIVGAPGIGKSRLIYELMALVEGDGGGWLWRQGRSLPYADRGAFSAFADIVKAQVGIVDTDSPRDAQAKLRSAVGAVVADPAEAQLLVRQVATLVGASTGEASDVRADEAPAAWRRLVEVVAEREPMVFVFEDLHWAEDALLDFVDSLAEWLRGVPLLIVGTARPELFERRPSWGGGKANAVSLSLSPLSERQTASLVRDLLASGDLDAQTEETLVARAGGNPLYAEQFVRMSRERGVFDARAIPINVQGVIAARLDALSAAEKSILHDASILGDVFSPIGVTALGSAEPSGVAALFHTLERKEFVQRARGSSTADGEYCFQHVLLRDVAYSQVPRSARAEKHQRAAEWLESRGRPDEYSETLVHHYGAALELASATGRRDERLVARTRHFATLAAERAMQLNAFDTAAGYYRRALELVPDDDPERPTLVFGHARALHASGGSMFMEALEHARETLLGAGDRDAAAEAEVLMAEAWWYRGRHDLASEHLQGALDLVSDRPPSASKAKVLAQAARFQMLGSDGEAAIAIARDAIVLAEELHLSDVQADALITLGSARFHLEDLDGKHDIARGLDLALAGGHLHTAARAYNNLGDATDDLRRSAEMVAAAADLHRRLGNRYRERYLQVTQAWLDIARGRWDVALSSAEEFIAECEAGEHHYAEAWARLARGSINLARGETDRVQADVVRALQHARVAEDPQVLYSVLSFAARAYWELGQPEDARGSADEVLRTGRPEVIANDEDLVLIAPALQIAEHVSDAFARVPSNRPMRAAVVAYIDGRIADSGRIFDELGMAASAAQVRLYGARQLLDRGQQEAAMAEAEKAVAFHTSVGATRYVREGEELMRAAHGERHEPRPA